MKKETKNIVIKILILIALFLYGVVWGSIICKAEARGLPPTTNLWDSVIPTDEPTILVKPCCTAKPPVVITDDTDNTEPIETPVVNHSSYSSKYHKYLCTIHPELKYFFINKCVFK